MLSKKTVFVVGAGASKEVGLPVGRELRDQIAVKLDLRFEFLEKFIGKGDLAIFHVLRQKYPADINRYLAACWAVSGGIGLSQSIDDFVSAHDHDKDIAICSKLAITKCILEAERESKLFYEKNNARDTINFNKIQGTWYPAFYNLLSDGVNKTKLKNIFDNVTIVSFNYDRCIEHFLIHAIAENYRIPMSEAQIIMYELPIFHPFGFVGEYSSTQFQGVGFGFKGLPELDTIVKSIRTYTEQVHDKEGLAAVQKAIAEAEVIVFLGNAFHENNLNLLAAGTSNQAGKVIYATRKGISDNDLEIVIDRVASIVDRKGVHRIQKGNCNFSSECSELFENYRLSLRG